MAASEDVKQWPKQDKRRFLHAVYRVGNLEATIDYYKKHFGMKQLRYRDVPDVSNTTVVVFADMRNGLVYGTYMYMLIHHVDSLSSRRVILQSLQSKLHHLQDKYRNAFMGYGPEDTNFCLELTENYDKDSYDLGTGFGHFALALPDVYKTCESIKQSGEFHACIVMIMNVIIMIVVLTSPA